ncbi:unnamed protein product [Adineta steineri]|uniref:EF-hand domain-containing protein n=2 Tax=Adineta steineri TaxID=433720 RepID=A0A818RF52_9BILA|nr:unnamed protein product [Adineta steineri]CAF3656517.1 unnamed protein product [Adineta steineri]
MTSTLNDSLNIDLVNTKAYPTISALPKTQATKILEVLQAAHGKIKIRIKPDLFECTAWYIINETSNILTMSRCMPKKNIFELFQSENELEFYKQSHTIATTILNIQIQQEQTSSQYHIHILFIAYASAFELFTCKLCSRKFQPDRLLHVIRSVDFFILNNNKMSSTMTSPNTSIPITKMVNDLFLQWLSLPDTRTTLSSALNSVRTNSKMPEPIVYSKIYTNRIGGFSKSQHFDSPPVSPVPRTTSSPRYTSSNNFSIGDTTPGISNNNNNDAPKQRSSKKIYTDNITPTTDQQPVTTEKFSTPQLTKPDVVPTSATSSTYVSPNRVLPSTTTTTTPSKPSQQTPVLQPPSNAIRDQSPKTNNISYEGFDNNKPSPNANTTKTPVSSNEQISRPMPTPSFVPQTTPTVIKQEQKQKIAENIPKFYFPNGKLTATSTNETILVKQLRQVKEELFLPKHDKLHLEDFGKLAQLTGLSLYWKAPLFRACVHDCLGPKVTITSTTTINYSQYESFWTKVCKNNHDNALKFIYVLIHSLSSTSYPMNRQYLTLDDWDYLVQDIIDTHPGLKFLREAKEFHSRYIKTVVARVYYNCNRSWTMKLTVQELRRSNFLQTFDRLEQEDDINRIHDYFSYEHFYVIYCKFWELDADHDLYISRDDLAKHCNGAISNKMIDRIFSGAVSSSNMKEGKMSYSEFVWFLISEEDKRSPTSIEYWFRCMDIDGDGILSMFELDYFYQEQVHKMEIYGIEYMPFEDCICQMLDLVKPEEANKIRLKDLKRCKLTNVFFDTFFNLEKYLNNEQKDPFSNLKDPDSPELSDWVKYAEGEYDNLTHEDGGNDNLDDGNYDEDFEDEDHEVEEVTSKRLANNAVSPPQRLGGSELNNKIDDLEDELKRWKD